MDALAGTPWLRAGVPPHLGRTSRAGRRRRARTASRRPGAARRRRPPLCRPPGHRRAHEQQFAPPPRAFFSGPKSEQVRVLSTKRFRVAWVPGGPTGPAGICCGLMATRRRQCQIFHAPQAAGEWLAGGATRSISIICTNTLLMLPNPRRPTNSKPPRPHDMDNTQRRDGSKGRRTAPTRRLRRGRTRGRRNPSMTLATPTPSAPALSRRRHSQRRSAPLQTAPPATCAAAATAA